MYGFIMGKKVETFFENEKRNVSAVTLDDNR